MISKDDTRLCRAVRGCICMADVFLRPQPLKCSTYETEQEVGDPQVPQELKQVKSQIYTLKKDEVKRGWTCTLIVSWSLCGFDYLAVGHCNLSSSRSPSKSHAPSASRFGVSRRPCGAAHEQHRAFKMQSQSATANTQMRGLVGPHTDVDA